MKHEVSFLVGTYTEDILFGTGRILHGLGEGVYLYTLDEQSGNLTFEAVFEGIVNPSYLVCSEDGNYVYLVNELKEHEGGAYGGTVSAYRFDKEKKEMTFLNSFPTEGTDPCHLTVDKNRSMLFCANFMSGSITSYRLAREGSIDAKIEHIQHEGSSVDPARQNGPHAHAAVLSPDERFLFVPDLGLDSTIVYHIDRGSHKLERRDALAVPAVPGSGPRHVVFHPNGLYAYIVHELNSTVASYTYDKESGRLTETGIVSTLPPGCRVASTCADLRISPCGCHLYASNRGHDSIAVYACGELGTLRLLSITSTLGGCPRNFSVTKDGRYLLAANQDSNSIAVFSRDEKTGLITFSSMQESVPTPVCLEFTRK